MSSLYRRDILTELATYLEMPEALVLHGARQVGKTSLLFLLRQDLVKRDQRVVYLDLEDSRFVSLLNRGVEELLLYLRGEGVDLDALIRDSGRVFLLLDEIQYLADPSSLIKLIVDHHRHLKLVVSGSSSFEIRSKFRDSLVGRTIDFEIHPLSFREMLRFQAVPFDDSIPLTPLKREELRSRYKEYCLCGGYPRIVLTDERAKKERYLQQIIDTYIRKDIRDLAEIRDPARFNRLVEILASQGGQLLNVTELCNTVGLARPTVERYLFLLEQTFILCLVRPYHRNLRSEITRMPKVFFFDTGLMQMLWLKGLQRELSGAVLETSVFSELVKHRGRRNLRFWRSVQGQEVDFVLEKPGMTDYLEVKTRFPRTFPSLPTGIRQGAMAETGRRARVVALEGTPSGPGMCFPWEIPVPGADGSE